MNSLKNMSSVGRLALANTRRFAEKKWDHKDWKKLDAQLPEGLHPEFYKFKALQKKYQEPNGVPIYLKGGLKDKILLGITIAGIGLGIVMDIDLLMKLP